MKTSDISTKPGGSPRSQDPNRHQRPCRVQLVRRIPGLRRFLLSHPRALGAVGAGPVPYLVAELWFDDAAALKAALRSPEMADTGAHAEALGVPMTMFAGDVEES
ncbi:EthD family reductase [Nocardioides sp.]|uniref:EthD family reductase n=1 Tax=Nocardioides sp. TaxID=35761 RepID=UPI002CE83A54|nr:EthD family reductase [Nocardioides sp.]HVX53528.1 EthD family reductase [Nocardioides sp.]